MNTFHDLSPVIAWGGFGRGDDYATVEYSPDGTQLWAQRYNGPGDSGDQATALELDSTGNIHVTGFSWGDFEDFATLKYAPDGSELWVRRYDEGFAARDYARALAVDAEGNVYVTGPSWVFLRPWDYLTLKYDADGNMLWDPPPRYDRSGEGLGGSDIPMTIAVDASGNAYVTGASEGGCSRSDYLTVQYVPDGIELWTWAYNGPDNARDKPAALAVDNSGNVYVTGFSGRTSTLYDYATVRHAP